MNWEGVAHVTRQQSSSGADSGADEPILTIAGTQAIDPAADPDARRKFRDVLGQFATGVTVMTTLTPEGFSSPRSASQ